MSEQIEDPVPSSYYCEVGKHTVPWEDIHGGAWCHYCHRRFCSEHQGHKNLPAGFMMSCKDHIPEVHNMNAERLREARKEIRAREEEETREQISRQRDIHFADFAQALARELTEAHVFYDTTGIGQLILVRRAYDLATHILNNMPSSVVVYEPVHEVIMRTPDLTEFPEE
jgi:hypothetical protein